MDKKSRQKQFEQLAEASAPRLSGKRRSDLNHYDQMAACHLEELGYLAAHATDPENYTGSVSRPVPARHQEFA